MDETGYLILWDPLFKKNIKKEIICPSIITAYFILKKQYDELNNEILKLLRPFVALEDFKNVNKQVLKKSISFDNEFILKVKKMLSEFEIIKGSLLLWEKTRGLTEDVNIDNIRKNNFFKGLKKSKSLDELKKKFYKVSKKLIVENIKKDEGYKMKRNSIFLNELTFLIKEYDNLK